MVESESESNIPRATKIVCTLGPSSDDADTIRGLARAGMNVARLNASHGTPEQRADLIRRLRRVDEEMDRTLAVMLDLPGPEIRTTDRAEPAQLSEGETVRFLPGETDDPDAIGVTTALAAVAPGDRVLVDDGRVETTVQRVDGDVVVARVDSGGPVGGHEGVNVPGVDLGLDPVTEADERELDLAGEIGVDFVAASFVRDGEDVLRVNRAIENRGVEVPVVAKVERADAVANLASIVAVADGVMVARGDLGVECPLEEVPLEQKRMISRCRTAGVPVVTATEMLDSMATARRPTRAEAADVANAVLDGTDAVMLSGETAIGDHPVHVVETMDRIVRSVERSEEYAATSEDHVPAADTSKTDALARSARFLARDTGATAVVAATESGYTARKISKYRPDVPIVAATASDEIRRRLALSWGVVPRCASIVEGDAGTIINEAVGTALEIDLVSPGDTVVALAGMMGVNGPSTTNTLKVHVAAEAVASGRPIVTGAAAGPLCRLRTGEEDVPEGAIVALPAGFDGEFADPTRFAGIVDGDPGQTNYAAMVARELDLPTIADAVVPDRVPDGTQVTLDADRGVLYAAGVAE
jgi:pyruvate kinase